MQMLFISGIVLEVWSLVSQKRDVKVVNGACDGFCGVRDHSYWLHILDSEGNEKLYSHKGKKFPHLIPACKPGNIVTDFT